jgi:hypothetical protein
MSPDPLAAQDRLLHRGFSRIKRGMTFERIVNEVHEEIERLKQNRTDDPARLKRREEMNKASRDRMREMLERRWGKDKQ